MKKILSLALVFMMSLLGCKGQTPSERPQCQDDAFDNAVEKWLSFSVPVKGVEELSQENLTNYLILDAREKEEYKTSHIEGAQHIGYNQFNIENLNHVDKEQPIVVYCSIGYRSEKIGEKLQKAGFKNVFNLYGSIFEWANQGQPLVDSNGQPTKNIHTYNKKWSKWMLNETYKKVW